MPTANLNWEHYSYSKIKALNIMNLGKSRRPEGRGFENLYKLGLGGGGPGGGGGSENPRFWRTS